MIPLTYEGMTVIEVIAAAGGLKNTDRGHNIRLIRPPFDQPQVEIIDLTTLAGMQRAQLHVQPGDVVYIEPRPQALQNGLRDVAPVLNLVSSSFAILVVVLNLLNNG